MRKLLKSTLFLLLFLMTLQAQAQSQDSIKLADKTVFIEIGIGLFMLESINYEQQIFSGESITWYGRLGAGYGVNFMDDWSNGPGGMAAITMLTGKRNNHFELVTGGFVGHNLDDNSLFAMPVFTAGYRYQEPNEGAIFKVKAGILEIGFGIGYSF